MGKNKKKKKQKERTLALNERTRRFIYAIAAFVFSALFLLASGGYGGIVGNGIYRSMTFLFGAGYFLFPVIFLALGIVFIRAREQKVVSVSSLGAFISFLAALGILGVIDKEGGAVGALLAAPFLRLFDLYTSLVILTGLLVVGAVIAFESVPILSWLRRIFAPARSKKMGADEAGNEAPEEPYEESEEPESDEDESDTSDEGEVAENESAKEESEKEKRGLLFGLGGGLRKGAPTAIRADLLGGKPYTPPPLSLLQNTKGKPGVGDIKANSNIIKRMLAHFGINIEVDEVTVGPSVTRYAIKPAQGVKLSRIVGLQNDLSLALAAHPIRIEAPIPGRSLVGIEVPNTTRMTVGLSSLISESEFSGSSRSLMIALGREVTGRARFEDIGKMPHLLIAGATGSGKSVAIHTIINSLVYRNSPEMLRFILIDPKRVELTLYNNIPHLLTPVITGAKKAILALKWASKEMERRYDVLEAESVRDITSYHKTVALPAYEAHRKKTNGGAEGDDAELSSELPERMPYIVIVIDELADIMSTYPRELEAAVVRLAQMSRATGIHLILSTQRPSVNVITGLIKANIPARVALQVASQTDSRTILDTSGAEKLLGAGDMLYVSGEMSKPVRLQSAFISEGEIKKVAKYLAKEYDGGPEELVMAGEGESNGSLGDSLASDEVLDEDELFEEARETVIQTQKASTTFLQRKLRIGYARAARLMDVLEERGVVGAGEGAKPREVLIKPGEEAEGYGKEAQN